MISRENFVKIMNALKTQYIQELEFADSLKPYFEGDLIFQLNHETYDMISDALESEICGNADQGWLSWWMYDCDWSELGEPPYICYLHDVKHELREVGDLYDFLILKVDNEAKSN